MGACIVEFQIPDFLSIAAFVSILLFILGEFLFAMRRSQMQMTKIFPKSTFYFSDSNYFMAVGNSVECFIYAPS